MAEPQATDLAGKENQEPSGGSGISRAPARNSRLPSFAGWIGARRVELLLFVLIWLTYAYFYQSTQHNGAARFDQARAIVEDGTLHIDRFTYNTADVIEYGREGEARHWYPNKAPGTTLLAVAPFWLWTKVVGAFGVEEPLFWHIVAYLTILSTIALLSALAAVAMYAVLRRLTGSVAAPAAAVVAVWLGTICFPFSTLFFSHMQAAAQLVIAFYFLFKYRWDGPDKMRAPAAQLSLAGFLCGFTLATEYPTLLLVLALCAYFAHFLFWRDDPRKRKVVLGAAFAVGLIVGGMILVAYNVAAFEKPFFVPYRQYATEGAASSFPGHKKGYVGVHWPGIEDFSKVLGAITVKPQRGLLYLGVERWVPYACNPILWLALPGLILLFLRKGLWTEAAFVLVVTIFYFVFNACFGDSIVYWGGAWSVGPRHLVPLIPFLALPLAAAAQRLRLLFGLLLALSAFYMLLATAVEPRVPYEYTNPAKTLFLPNYLRGNLGLNRLGLFDIRRRDHTGDPVATNFGKLIGLPGRLQLAPLMAFWLLAGGGLIVAAGRPREKFTNDDQTESQQRSLFGTLSNPSFWRVSSFVALVAFVDAVVALPQFHAARQKSELASSGGLAGRYFSNGRWRGQPAFVRKDDAINFNWTYDPLFYGQYSVEWTGSIRIDRPGRYVFATQSDDGSVLEIDGRTVVDNGGKHAPRYKDGAIEFEKAGDYPIRIRLVNYDGWGQIRVTWQPPGAVSHTLIPAEKLSPPGAVEEAE